MRLRRKPRVVRVQILNGLRMQGLPGYGDVIELVPGEDVRLTWTMEQNVCDRGLTSKDGKHRLVSRTVAIPMVVRLAPGGRS